jgi:hypothetical protein
MPTKSKICPAVRDDPLPKMQAVRVFEKLKNGSGRPDIEEFELEDQAHLCHRLFERIWLCSLLFADLLSG